MPWRGPEYPGEFPSLGWQILEWIEWLIPIPDGPHRGEPFKPTREQAEFVVRLYKLEPKTGRRWFDEAMLIRPKGWGKSPFFASLGWAEAYGPVRFAGWDADGEPVGLPPPTPWVQCAALAEDQTENTWKPLYEMAAHHNSRLLDEYPDIDLGETRIFLRDSGGKVEPVTSRAGTRQGQRVTAAIIDEAHELKPHNGGTKLTDTIRGNVSKMNGVVLQSTNAHLPGLGCVAETTIDAAAEDPHILIDWRQPPKVEDLSNLRQLKRAVRIAYGDSLPFVDVDRTVRAVLDPRRTVADGIRLYLNRSDGGSADRYFDMNLFDERADRSAKRPRRGEPITLGFDGSKFRDATVLYGCTAGGHLFPLGWWERDDVDDVTWEVSGIEVDRAVEEAFATWRVSRMYADPPYWQDYVDRWAERWGKERVIAWWTNRPKQMADALERLSTAIRSGEDVTHDGDPRARIHFANAFTKEDRGHRIIRKEHPNSMNHIDGAMAATLAYEARGDAIAAGLMSKRRTKSMTM